MSAARRMTSPASLAGRANFAGLVQQLAAIALRYGLAVVFVWYGGMKFTPYEAGGIAPFVMNSPLVGWWHALLGIKGTSTMLGIYEVATGLLLASRLVSPRASVLGGAMAVLTYLVTLSFLFTTPGVAEPLAGGFPALSAPVGQFLLKDVVLLAASLWCLGESLQVDPSRSFKQQDPGSTTR